jgi:hypothetical protein
MLMLKPSKAGVESAGRRSTADEAGQACVVRKMERSGRQVFGAVPRSGRESVHRGGDIGDGPMPEA